MSLILKPTFFFVFLFIFAITKTGAQPQGDGFLGVEIVGGWHGGTSELEGERVNNNVIDLSLAFVGASPGYEVVTKMVFSSDLIHIVKHFYGDSSYLQHRELNPFSFFEFYIQYFASSLWTNAILLVGLGVGHMGYLSPSFDYNPYTFFISPSASIRWFLSDSWAILVQADFPVGTYRRNATRLWHFRTFGEIIFEPRGFIYNPITYTVFLALGVQYEYVELRTQNGVFAQLHKVNPYFRFTFLY